MDFDEIKRELKYILQEDLKKVYNHLSKILNPNSAYSDRLTLLMSRLIKLNRDFSTGIISNTENNEQLNLLKSNTIDFINSIPESDLAENSFINQQSKITEEDDLLKIKIFELLDLIDESKKKKKTIDTQDESKDDLILKLSDVIEKNQELKVKLKQVENENKHLQDMLLDREVLRVGILIALSDDDFDKREADFLLNRAEAMNDKIGHLSELSKRKILREAILMSCADGEFKHREFLEIKTLCKNYNFPDSYIQKEIIETCIKRNVRPPKSLYDAYEEYQKNNNLQLEN